ncbi:lytic transglycosylase domain-containing protein [Nitriliruptoraceae bacterium ZYF776]|nr:lytic transglycosylase domain-containing protein [Profundirhabdus halotolerans]
MAAALPAIPRPPAADPVTFAERPGGALPAERGSEPSSAAPAAPGPGDGDEASRDGDLPGDDPGTRDAPVDEPPAPEPTPEPAPPTVPGRSADAVLPVLDPETISAVAARTGIPDRALAAYASAARLLEEERPGCGITWSTLAGIGWVESRHGNYGTARLREDGVPTEPIIGIALDGGPNVRAIRDTDGGRLDGDATWDRAVGPMQFIPSTWARWGADGSGDGTADPQHIDDAALAAARYLCASGGDLTQASSWWRAVLTYNRSEAYAHHVLEAANTYARRSHG